MDINDALADVPDGAPHVQFKSPQSPDDEDVRRMIDQVCMRKSIDCCCWTKDEMKLRASNDKLLAAGFARTSVTKPPQSMSHQQRVPCTILCAVLLHRMSHAPQRTVCVAATFEQSTIRCPTEDSVRGYMSITLSESLSLLTQRTECAVTSAHPLCYFLSLPLQVFSI